MLPLPLACPAAAGSEDPLSILQVNCLRCHTEDQRKGGLVLSSREAVILGGDSGPSAEPGHSGGSLLVDTLFPDSEMHMPPKGQLSPAQIVALEHWIDEGLPWDSARWEQLLRVPVDAPVTLGALPGGYRPVFALALSPDGKILAAGRGHQIEWLETSGAEGEEAVLKPAAAPVSPGPDPVQSLAWSPDGKLLAAGSFRRVTLWDAATREKRGEITEGFSGRVSALAFTPDSKLLLAADSVDAFSGRLAGIDPAAAAITWIRQAHDDAIFAVAISPDGARAATASADKSIKIWEPGAGELILSMEGHTGYVLAAAFSPEGDRLATGGADEEVKVWEVATGKKVANFGSPRTGPVTAVAWTHDPDRAKQRAEEKDPEKAAEINIDRITALNEAGQPRVYTELKEHQGEQRSTGARERAIDPAEGELASVALDPATLRLHAGSTRGAIYSWSADGKLAATLEPEPDLAQAAAP